MDVLEDDPRCSICNDLRWFHAGVWICENCDEQGWFGQVVAKVQFQQGVPDEFIDEHWDAIEQVEASRFQSWRFRMVKRLRGRFTIAWLVWLTGFVVIETWALLDRAPGDTLSEHVWFIARVSVVWFLLGGFLVWLIAHLLGPSARRWIDSWRDR